MISIDDIDGIALNGGIVLAVGTDDSAAVAPPRRLRFQRSSFRSFGRRP
ncbi:MAG: hypothetical protein H7146_11080 [Burkholderiaceae bacterium]|nr:hypothetical protein [Microbacteriaceae bacterium]